MILSKSLNESAPQALLLPHERHGSTLSLIRVTNVDIDKNQCAGD